MNGETKHSLLDSDGENLAVRAFLQLYGCTSSPSIEGMRDHLTESGFDGCWPEWAGVEFGFLTKGGAQDWLRHLFGLERAALPSVQDQQKPAGGAGDAGAVQVPQWSFSLDFRPSSEEPTEEGHYLLYNQCDGYHLAEAWFPEGAFCGFYAWPHDYISPKMYCAWAKLPDTVKTLYDMFAEKDRAAATIAKEVE